MMKILLIFFFLIFQNILLSQYRIQKEDVDFSFIQKILIDSSYKLKNFPFTKKEITNQNGLWQINYDKNFKEIYSNSYTFKKILLLKNGYSMDKQYVLNKKNQVISSIENYPLIAFDSIFNGIKTIHYYKNGSPKQVLFEKFVNDSLYRNNKYTNITNYYKNKKVKNYSYVDSKNEKNEFKKYSIFGFCKLELSHDKNEGSKSIKRKNFGKKVILTEKINGKYYEICFKKGHEIYRKKL